MNKILILFVLLTSIGANALTEKEKAIAFMKDWVTFANGRVEANSKVGEYLKTITLCIFITNQYCFA
jgi:hypothetical protein